MSNCSGVEEVFDEDGDVVEVIMPTYDDYDHSTNYDVETRVLRFEGRCDTEKEKGLTAEQDFELQRRLSLLVVEESVVRVCVESVGGGGSYMTIRYLDEESKRFKMSDPCEDGGEFIDDPADALGYAWALLKLP